MQDVVRLGVIGLGNIGLTHVELIQSGGVTDVHLAAVCARNQPTVDYRVPYFSNYRDLLSSGLVDAVLIATPTMAHVEIGLAACEQGLHVLMEKPIAMSVSQAQQLLEAVRPEQKFAAMLNQRFHPAFEQIAQVLRRGELGQILRYSWVMTAWYRPDIYYQASTWRGTWPGEGGGLLINQCIHNLDLLYWWLGLPGSVYADVGFGKYHAIEVEDEVSAILTYENGMTGTLTASSGEAPGMNQLDIIGDLGCIRYDGVQLTLQHGNSSVSSHRQNTREMFGMPDYELEVLPVGVSTNQHAGVLQNFVNAVLRDEPLMTPGEQSVGSLQLANGMLLSSWMKAAVSLPIDAQRYEKLLQGKIAESNLRKPVQVDVDIDMDASFR